MLWRLSCWPTQQNANGENSSYARAATLTMLSWRYLHYCYYSPLLATAIAVSAFALVATALVVAEATARVATSATSLQMRSSKQRLPRLKYRYYIMPLQLRSQQQCKNPARASSSVEERYPKALGNKFVHLARSIRCWAPLCRGSFDLRGSLLWRNHVSTVWLGSRRDSSRPCCLWVANDLMDCQWANSGYRSWGVRVRCTPTRLQLSANLCAISWFNHPKTDTKGIRAR